ncbi:MAG: DUF6314 family protein [Pseudomonadota bacterium]
MALPGGLDDFEGRWRIQRRIEDRLGPDARFEGVGIFTRDAEGLRYNETGQLHAAGQSFSATRRYSWRMEDTQIAVYFDDGRLFHSFELTGASRAGHDCAPDRYDVTYAFENWPAWRSVWEVRGPRKDYRMVSAFARE